MAKKKLTTPGGMDIASLLDPNSLKEVKEKEDALKATYMTNIQEKPKLDVLITESKIESSILTNQELKQEKEEIKEGGKKESTDEIQVVTEQEEKNQIKEVSQVVTNEKPADQSNAVPQKDRVKEKDREIPSYESFFVQYKPAKDEKRESTSVYSKNMIALRYIKGLDKGNDKNNITDLVNNILKTWIEQYSEDIKKHAKRSSPF